jgi:hypothetical protein
VVCEQWTSEVEAVVGQVLCAEEHRASVFHITFLAEEWAMTSACVLVR